MVQRSLPSGTVTFLFTDIERSTESVAQLGDRRYAEALQTHRNLLRAAFEKQDGIEVGTEGDAFFIAFARAGDAVTAADEGQSAVESHRWEDHGRLRVRMGLHTGEVVVQDNDYVGHDVHKAKRICDAGHGGQILVSDVTAALVAGHLPDATELVDLGFHRLKDLGKPQRLYQLRATGLQADFPALRVLDQVAGTLPVQLTTFVGREAELKEIASMLSSHRLVTLTGVGGCGKTRLAVQASGAEAQASPDGVFFCDLSRISEESSLVPALARTLSLGESSEDVAPVISLDSLRRSLARRRALLVLDNCEHLVGAVAELVEDLLVSCPHLRILATSREALEVPGERTWSVPSLDPVGEGTLLFGDRASALRSDFRISESNAASIRTICERLDGIPLAIELAAAQINHLTPQQIAERLDQRFMMLTGGRRRVQRQQTLQAAMDWSWDLLSDAERSLLARLAVFQGGCSLEAAESVCGGGGINVVAGLRALAAKSLVVVDESSLIARYRLLETVRLYAEEKLAASEDSGSLRARHRDFYLSWAEQLDPAAAMAPPGEADEWILDEADNVRAALRWSEAEGRLDLVGRLLTMTGVIWAVHWEEGSRRLRAAATAADLPDELRGRILAIVAYLLGGRGDRAGREYVDEAVGLLSEDHGPWLCMALYTRAIGLAIEAVINRSEELAAKAIGDAERSSRLGQAIGLRFEIRGWVGLGQVLTTLLRHAEAAHAWGQSTALAIALEEARQERTYGTARAQLLAAPAAGLMVNKHLLGDTWPKELERPLQAALGRLEAGRPRYSVALALHYQLQGDDRARLMLEGWADYLFEIAPPIVHRQPILLSGIFAAIESRWERAARLLASGMQPGVTLNASLYALYRHWLPRVRSELDPARARALRDEGRAMSIEDANAYALDFDRD